MAQEPIREYNDLPYTVEEADNWLQELDRRTSTTEEGLDTLDLLAKIVKASRTVKTLTPGPTVDLDFQEANTFWIRPDQDTTFNVVNPIVGLEIQIILEESEAPPFLDISFAYPAVGTAVFRSNGNFGQQYRSDVDHIFFLKMIKEGDDPIFTISGSYLNYSFN